MQQNAKNAIENENTAKCENATTGLGPIQQRVDVMIAIPGKIKQTVVIN